LFFWNKTNSVLSPESGAINRKLWQGGLEGLGGPEANLQNLGNQARFSLPTLKATGSRFEKIGQDADALWIRV
jgi:hypothetical protein